LKEIEPPEAELKYPSESLPKSTGRFQGAKKEPFKMIERPKSREETPKEGSDMQAHTALQRYRIALHNIQGRHSSSLKATVMPCGIRHLNTR